MGEEHVLGPNEVQAMSAGSGVIHSEFNGSDTEPTHFFQIWLVPERAASSRPISSSRTTRREARHAATDGRTGSKHAAAGRVH